MQQLCSAQQSSVKNIIMYMHACANQALDVSILLRVTLPTHDINFPAFHISACLPLIHRSSASTWKYFFHISDGNSHKNFWNIRINMYSIGLCLLSTAGSCPWYSASVYTVQYCIVFISLVKHCPAHLQIILSLDLLVTYWISWAWHPTQPVLTLDR